MDGGPERYMFGLTEHLKSKGHEVIPYSVAYQKNQPSEYEKYFLKPAGTGKHAKLDKLEGGLSTKLKIAVRSVYSVEARNSLEKLIKDTKPDIVYCLNIVNHLSPSVIDAGHRQGVPVVLRMSDYNLLCPSYLFLRNGKICTDCEHGYYHALKGKCIYGSTVATLCRVIGMYYHKLIGIYNKVDAFVTPAIFMREMMIKSGYLADDIHYIPTFVDSTKWVPTYDNDGYILYFGRIMEEKGVDILIRSYKKSGIKSPLVIAGNGPDEYVNRMKSDLDEVNLTNVQFIGKKSGIELQQIVSRAKFIVVPSIWFDNSPNVIYESFAAGKPVIGSALGGICEQVNENTGILVEPGNIDELSEAIIKLNSSPELVIRLGQGARKQVIERHNIEDHVDRLLKLFSEVISDKKH